jgi:hypothetical protein
MSAEILLIGSAQAFFLGAFAPVSGTSTLFISGTGNIASGAMPLFLRAVDSKNANLTLTLLASSRTYSWESLGDYWQRYNTACDVSASYFCNDWEYMPYSASQASGASSYITMFTSGSYRSARNYQLPLFMSCSGDGVANNNLSLFLYAQNNETVHSGSTTLFNLGHGISNGTITMTISGEMPSSSGLITMVCNSYDRAETTIKLFTSGI